MNPAAIAKAVKRLGVIRFFPADPDARLEIMEQIRRIVGDGEVYGTTPEQRLAWLIDTLIVHMREWAGLPELRGVYATRWKPADGIEMYSTLPGFTPQDSEMAWIRESDTFKAELQAGQLPKLLEAAGCDSIELDVFPAVTSKTKRLSREALAETEREIQAAASKPTLTSAEKARRMEELQAALGMGGAA